MVAVPLSILDLAPIPSGGTAGGALRSTIDLARRAEEFGYHRFWIGEHHLAPGVACAAPQILIAQVAAATSRIRVGSGAVLTGHWTPLAIVEQFGTIDALYPGRVDLGLGRTGRPRTEIGKRLAQAAAAAPRQERVVDGLLIPKPFDFSGLAAAPMINLLGALLLLPGAESLDFADQVDQVAALLDGTFRTDDGVAAHVVPGEGADVRLWILGSTAGQSAQVAGERGLPFAANYHFAPANVLDTVEAYRRAFKPSAVLDEPYVVVSADVVVAEDDATARELAAPYGLWVHSIRTQLSAIPFPSPAEAARHQWTEAERAVVDDRVRTQFVGSPATVTERLRVLQRVTGADELLVTTMVHDHADRVRSFELLAADWHRP